MLTLAFSDVINFSSLGSLIELIEDREDKKEKTIDIYFNSCGGDFDAKQAFIDYFKRLKENGYRITLISVGDISSAAFEIFFCQHVERRILNMSWSAVHLPYSHKNINELSNNQCEIFRREQLEKHFPSILEWFTSLGFSNKEIKLLKEWKDIYLDTNRLQEIDKILSNKKGEEKQ